MNKLNKYINMLIFFFKNLNKYVSKFELLLKIFYIN